MWTSHQLVYFKQAVPDEAKRILHQHKVEILQQVEHIPKELYEPVGDTWTVLQDLEKISQMPGERLRVLDGRIKEVAKRYEETLDQTSQTTNRLNVSRFKYAIDEETQRYSKVLRGLDLKGNLTKRVLSGQNISE